MKNEMITFDEYKIDCEYFEREEIKSKNFNNSYIPCSPRISENCNHSLAGKVCYSKNNLCPYNIKNDEKINIGLSTLKDKINQKNK